MQLHHPLNSIRHCREEHEGRAQAQRQAFVHVHHLLPLDTEQPPVVWLDWDKLVCLLDVHLSQLRIVAQLLALTCKRGWTFLSWCCRLHCYPQGPKDQQLVSSYSIYSSLGYPMGLYWTPNFFASRVLTMISRLRPSCLPMYSSTILASGHGMLSRTCLR